MTGLFLTGLKLSHFRSHQITEIQTDARPIAITGANGAGKTNILEAVSLFSPGRGLRRASAEDMTRRPEALGWKLTSRVSILERPHEIETWSEAHTARQLKIDGKAASQLKLADLTRVLWLIPSMDRLFIEGADGRRRFLDRMTLSFTPQHGEMILTYEKAMRERNRLLKDQVRDAHWYKALELQMAESGSLIVSHRRAAVERLTQAQEAAQTAFPTAGLTLVDTEGDLSEASEDLARAFAESRPRDLQAGRTLVGPHRSDLVARYEAKDVAAKDCSTGEQKALLISLILANARALKEDLGYAPLVLLDEVAAHLDPTRRAALYDEISALGAQAWMTGTERSLFEALGDRARYLNVTDTNGISKVEQIA
ncbi:MAG: DNA replication/repair protein RecF [Pseudomonadota bacterium]